MTQIKYPTLAAFVLSMGILLASGIPHAEDEIDPYGQGARDASQPDTTGAGQVDQPHKPSGMDTERPMDLDEDQSPADRTPSDQLNPGMSGGDSQYKDRY